MSVPLFSVQSNPPFAAYPAQCLLCHWLLPQAELHRLPASVVLGLVLVQRVSGAQAQTQPEVGCSSHLS